ncbi:hypothetical protein DEU56DRAFT_870627 [Suillus clintonianus]|uniref:uncharacterized protein n=1 Tax=Suillus clintonianus TaxID=1904413 RepID=UPI001B872BCF|nr:uncharacterized protein DEU56DRAFT_870627 [Suillus clintonianus]KAG2142340.1 hypothetical protein DEU56DRAFT_870627 [Suillus clintonianus]
MTLAAIEDGTVTVNDVSHNITPRVNFMTENTRYYGPDSQLSAWSTARPLTSSDPCSAHGCEISILKMTTLQGAQLLHDILSKSSSGSGIVPGILNFGDATSPGGGFLIGLPTQEETIARSSTLYPSLMTDTAQQFYNLHRHDEKGGFFHHAFVYTPASVVMRNDAGDWVSPYDVDVLTSAAVNAGTVRRQIGNSVAHDEVENQIEATMRERMARILFLFEQQGSKNIVLGSFGTGVFRNNVEVVARLWSQLLVGDAARFNASFDRVVFGIIGEKTFMTFKDVFNQTER